MLTVSNEWKKYCSDIENVNSRQFTAKATITFSDNTTLNITASDIVQKGLKINKASSEVGKFGIGTAMMSTGQLILNNIEHKFDTYDFDGARIVIYIGLKLSTTTEYIKIATTNIVDSLSSAGTVILELNDDMIKLEKKFSSITVSYPITTFALLQTICTACGIVLKNSRIPNSTHNVPQNYTTSDMTCREIVAYISQISGGFAIIDEDGKLEIKSYIPLDDGQSYDGGSFVKGYTDGDTLDGGDFDFDETTNYGNSDFNSTYAHIYGFTNADIKKSDVEVTGVRVKAMGSDYDYGETYLDGEEGYVIEVSDNPLIQENQAEDTAYEISSEFIYFSYRPFEVTGLFNPTIQVGDACIVSHKGNSYKSFVTSISFTLGEDETYICDSETTEDNATETVSATQKAIIRASNKVRKYTDVKLTAYDLQMQMLTNLMTNCFGVYKTEEVQTDGSTIYYMHDKPTKAESATLWKMTADAFSVSTDGGATWNAGIDADGNAVVNVLSAIGINFDWAKGGTLSLGGTNNGNGLLKVFDNSGNLITRLDKDGGKIAGFDVVGNSLRSVKNITTNGTEYEYTTQFNGHYTETSEYLQQIYEAGLPILRIQRKTANGDIEPIFYLTDTGNLVAKGSVGLDGNVMCAGDAWFDGNTEINGNTEISGTLGITCTADFRGGISLKSGGLTAWYNLGNGDGQVVFTGEDLVTIKNWFISQGILS